MQQNRKKITETKQIYFGSSYQKILGVELHYDLIIFLVTQLLSQNKLCFLVQNNLEYLCA